MRPLILIALLCVACGQSPSPNPPETHEKLAPGPWRFTLDLGEVELPIETEISLTAAGKFALHIENAGEVITADSGRISKDSLFITMPVFDSEFRARIESPFLIVGEWINHTKENYSIPFVAEQGKTFRFSPARDTTRLPNRYKVVFSPNSDNPYDAILRLQRDEEGYSGTFMTETGDYRYLEGNVINNRLYLSTFDGSHAFYFAADIHDDQLTDGVFISGTHFETDWHATADTTFTLTDPTQLTSLKPGLDTIDFALPNPEGDTVSWTDLDLEDKVVVIEITGSWCPNCMDANRALNELSENYKAKDIRILPITFERSDDLEEALPSIRRMQKATGMEESFLFGGRASKENVERALPMIDDFMSYPTLIFVGKDRRVARIFTGFYGPGTGQPYRDFMSDTRLLLDSLVAVE